MSKKQLVSRVLLAAIVVCVAAIGLSQSAQAQTVNCAVTYNIVNDWGSGFTADVTIKNNGTAAINGWTLTWTFPGNQQITNIWNATYTQSGAAVSATNVSYNATIGPNGGTVNFGFNANYSGTNAKPASFKLNGATCQ